MTIVWLVLGWEGFSVSQYTKTPKHELDIGGGRESLRLDPDYIGPTE
jgi:hypothetical protein